jgi:DNA-nicking Smr family endonuclease
MSKNKDDTGRRKLKGDETQLWQRVVTDVQPLGRRGNTNPPADPLDPKPQTSEQPATPDKSNQIPRPRAPSPLERPSKAPEPEPELEHGVAPGLDKRTLAKLRRGQIPVESQIDLHRYTQEQAHRALDSFLDASQMAGRRCVLVITGKGLRADGSVGVLRKGVPHWLNLPPNRARVLAFCHATPADGGEGALYVLLRRIKR